MSALNNEFSHTHLQHYVPFSNNYVQTMNAGDRLIAIRGGNRLKVTSDNGNFDENGRSIPVPIRDMRTITPIETFMTELTNLVTRYNSHNISKACDLLRLNIDAIRISSKDVRLTEVDNYNIKMFHKNVCNLVDAIDADMAPYRGNCPVGKIYEARKWLHVRIDDGLTSLLTAKKLNFEFGSIDQIDEMLAGLTVARREMVDREVDEKIKVRDIERMHQDRATENAALKTKSAELAAENARLRKESEEFEAALYAKFEEAKYSKSSQSPVRADRKGERSD